MEVMSSTHNRSTGWTRRAFLRLGLLAGGTALFPQGRMRAQAGSGSGGGGAVSRFTPFTQELFRPEVLRPFDLDPAPGSAEVRFGRPSRPRGRFEDVAH